MVRGVVALVTLVALPSAAAFRGDPPPPSDLAPIWSPDASAIVFTRTPVPLGGGTFVMTRVGTGVRRLPIPASVVFSPDWKWVAYLDPSAGPSAIVVATPEGGLARKVAEGREPSWSPAGDRLAYVAAGSVLEVVDADGSGRRVVTELASGPRWSPDGRRIAFLVSANTPTQALGVVDSDGRNRRVLLRAAHISGFEWSPDGTTIAAFSTGPNVRELGPYRMGTLTLVRVRDGRARTFRVPLTGGGGALDWSPDGQHIVLSGLMRFDVRRGRTVRLLRFGAYPQYSPDGRWITFSGGGACGQRNGIFVIPANGGRPARLTNDCRIVGGPGRDVLKGSEFTDVLLGLGGDDTLNAFDDFFYEGDELDGGAGDDRLTGSIGTDILRGGPGRDVLDGGSAPDVLYAVDGERDEVRCGTTRGSGVIERDVVYADKQDLVRADCEHVFRRHGIQPLERTWFSITVWPRGGGESRRRVLACAPPRGTLPNRRAACARLARMGDPFAPISPEADCPVRAVEPAVARVTGYLQGRYVSVFMRRSDGCEIARWDRFAFLFVS